MQNTFTIIEFSYGYYYYRLFSNLYVVVFSSGYHLHRLFLSCLFVLVVQWEKKISNSCSVCLVFFFFLQVRQRCVLVLVVLLKQLVIGRGGTLDQSMSFEILLNLIYIYYSKQRLQRQLYLLFKCTGMMCQLNISHDLMTTLFLLCISLLLKFSLYYKLLSVN